MNKNELVDKLIKYFMNENTYLKKYDIPTSYEDKRLFLRGIINLREPSPLDEEVLKLEDNLLQMELSSKNITDVSDIQVIKNSMCIWRGDITTLKIDVIVNACNSSLLGCFIPNHSCIDNQIHSNAGIRLRLECNSIMKGSEERVGSAKITKAYNLPSRYVIHTVGPMVRDTLTEQEKYELKSCYISCMELARKENIKTIAFPTISTGVFHFPKSEASKIAVTAVEEYLTKYPNSFEKVVFNVFEKEDELYYERLLKD